MKRTKIFFVGLMLSIRVHSVIAAGTEGLSFLRLGHGAQAAGMGEAHTAVAEGAQAVYWNPAGLGLTEHPDLTLSHLQYWEDTSGQYAALALPLRKGKVGALGFSVTRFSVDNIEGRDAQSEVVSSDLQQQDMSLQASYGIHLFSAQDSLDRQGLFVGASVKSISEKLAGQSASTFGADVGVQYRPGVWVSRHMGEWTRRLSLGLTERNLGNGLKFDKEETPLPRSTRVGFAYTHFLWGDALNLASDWDVLPNGENHWSAGGEFWVKNMLALRVGVVEGQDIGSQFRMGAGFRFRAIQVDYALATYGDEFGATHRLSLGFKFGQGVQQTTGLKQDLLDYYLTQARETLAAGSSYEAVIAANHVLQIDSRNTEALQILFEAGEKIKPAATLPPPTESQP